tara:strand:+ start:1844 stop:3385 length:1542 start_codon:yes stop_codon:yes gene_type:complete
MAVETWSESIKAFCHPRVITMLFLGISAGIPLLLIFSSLSLWLREAGVDRSAVTYFSWAALGYSFKFVWAPLVDKLPLPLLTKMLGRRRAWLLLSQLMIMLAISMVALIDPATDTLSAMAWAAVFLGFWAATQDIVIDAYRIESAETDLQTLMASSYIAGYRIGMLLAGAGALYLASYLGSTNEVYSYQAWQWTYLIMAAVMLIGVLTTLLIKEPHERESEESVHSIKNYVSFFALFFVIVASFITVFYISGELTQTAKLNLSSLLGNNNLSSFLVELGRLSLALTFAGIVAKLFVSLGIVQQQQVSQTYIAPVKDFFDRYGLSVAFLLLALVGLYRISDIVLGVITNVFYQDLGFTKPVIANVVKSFGLGMTILGGFLGGLLAIRFGVMKILFLGAVLSALTNLLFMLLAQVGQDITMLYVVIAADNLSAGLASAAFIAFLSSLTNISFTAMQYAIFSSLMTLLPKILGGYSGTIVENIGYEQFFLITAVMGIPVLLLIVLANKHLDIKNPL